MNVANSTISAQQLFENGKKLLVDDPVEAIQIFKQSAELAAQSKNHTLQADILTLKGRVCRQHGNTYQSLKILIRAYRLLNEHLKTDRRRLSLVYRELAVLYSNDFKDHMTSIEYGYKCLQQNVPDLNGIFYNNIASAYIQIGKFDIAKELIDKGIKQAQLLNMKVVEGYLHENSALMNNSLQNYDKAIDYFKLAIKAALDPSVTEAERQDQLTLIAFSYSGLSTAYLKLNKFDKAKEMLSRSLETSIRGKLKTKISTCYLKEGEIHLAQNNLDAFQNIYKKAQAYCQQNSYFEDLTCWYGFQLKLHEDSGDYKTALNYSKLITESKKQKEDKAKDINVTSLLESKEMEILDLENRNREMQVQKEELEQFAYIVTHDIKTPLSNISNFTGLLARKSPEIMKSDLKPLLDIIVKSSSHLNRMLTSLMQYVTLGENDGLIKECDLTVIIEDIKETHDYLICQKNATIKTRGITKVNMRKVHLERILDNLIKNALKFTEPGIKPEIIIDLSEDHSKYKFKVIDNGIGVHDDFKDQIFQIFKQLDKENYPGTGMGLSICKKIINSYFGDIWLTSNEDRGTTFHFTIPKSNYS